MTTSEQQQQIEQALEQGNKIGAIKLCREATGKDLKEAKDEIDALEAQLRQKNPERFQSAANKGSGCASAIVLCLGFGTAATMLIKSFLS